MLLLPKYLAYKSHTFKGARRLSKYCSDVVSFPTIYFTESSLDFCQKHMQTADRSSDKSTYE